MKFCVSGTGPTQKGTGPTWFYRNPHSTPFVFGQPEEFQGASHAYRTDAELPDSVKDNLPSHAQDIYREAFNSAWEEYKDAAKRRGNESREEVAHKVAWAAVKQKYEKIGEEWRAKD